MGKCGRFNGWKSGMRVDVIVSVDEKNNKNQSPSSPKNLPPITPYL